MLLNGFRPGDALHDVVGQYRRIAANSYRMRSRSGKVYVLQHTSGAWWLGHGRFCNIARMCLMRRISASFEPQSASGAWKHVLGGHIVAVARRVAVSCVLAHRTRPPKTKTAAPSPAPADFSMWVNGVAPGEKVMVVTRFPQRVRHAHPTVAPTARPTVAPTARPTVAPTQHHGTARSAAPTPVVFAAMPQSGHRPWPKSDHTWSIVIKGQGPTAAAAGCMGKFERLRQEDNVFWLSEPEWQGPGISCGAPGGRAFLFFNARHHMWEVASGPSAEYPHSVAGKAHLEVHLSGSGTDAMQPCYVSNWVLYVNDAAPKFAPHLNVRCCTATMRNGYARGCAPFQSEVAPTPVPTPFPTPEPTMFPPLPKAGPDLLQTQLPPAAQTGRSRTAGNGAGAHAGTGLRSAPILAASALLVAGIFVTALRVRQKGAVGEYTAIGAGRAGAKKVCCLCFTVRPSRQAVSHHETLDRILAGEESSDDDAI